MTNKIQSMLTIALTAAVLALLVDRVIEPAQAQDCASTLDVAMKVDMAANRVLSCIDRSVFEGYIYDGWFDGKVSNPCY